MSEGQRRNPLWLAALAFAAGLATLMSWPSSWWGYLGFAAGGALLFAHSLSERRRAEQALLVAERASLDAKRASLCGQPLGAGRR